jgi:hypothetical protein
MPHWLFVDWAGVDSSGESASVNALYHGALRAVVDITRCLDRPDLARKYAAIAEEVRSGMKQTLWDEERRCFRESWREGALSKEISEQANCWAVAFGAVDGDVAADVMQAITQNKQASVHIGTPYFAFYMLDSLCTTGGHSQALEYVRDRWSPMLNWGATTWWETWQTNASLCHGWSSAPTYFLQAEILGVKPQRPGWEEITIEPHPAGLSWARGKVPSPLGPISVEWKKERTFTLRIEVPAKTRVRLPEVECATVNVQRGSDGKECVFERLTDDQGATSIIVPDAGVYLFHCV